MKLIISVEDNLEPVIEPKKYDVGYAQLISCEELGQAIQDYIFEAVESKNKEVPF
jgi:hypothetical protein